MKTLMRSCAHLERNQINIYWSQSCGGVDVVEENGHILRPIRYAYIFDHVHSTINSALRARGLYRSLPVVSDK
jgi:hypothetical protein